MEINEMVRRRVGLRLGSLHQEDHRYARRINRHRSGQDHLSPGCNLLSGGGPYIYANYVARATAKPPG